MLPLKNHYVGQVRTWNGFQKLHFRASKFKKFLGEHAPGPPPLPQATGASGAHLACLPAYKFLATAMDGFMNITMHMWTGPQRETMILSNGYWFAPLQ